MSMASVIATLDEFEASDVLGHAAKLTPMFFEGLDRLKQTGLVTRVRGEGLVFGIECADFNGKPANEVANAIVKACYLGLPGRDGIHFLGALAGKVLRVSPPLTMTVEETRDSLNLLFDICQTVAKS